MLKFVDIHRVSPSHIFVATAENTILNILVSSIYVTTVVVFPSSKVVRHCKNIYPMKQSIHIQWNILKHLSKAGCRREKGGRKSPVLMQVNSSGGKAGEFHFVVSFCVGKKRHKLKSSRLCRPSTFKMPCILNRLDRQAKSSIYIDRKNQSLWSGLNLLVKTCKKEQI